MITPPKKLHFECIGCGDCCRRPGEVRFDDETFEAIADYLSLTLEEFRKAYQVGYDPFDKETWTIGTESDPCPFLENNECQIYPVRPRQCRTYPFWPEVVRSRRRWDREETYCPGINQGPKIPEDFVLKMLKAEIEQLPVRHIETTESD